MDEKKFKNLIEQITSEFYTEEKEMFNLYFDIHFKSLVDFSNITSEKNEDELSYNFGSSVLTVLKFLSVMLGTYKTIIEIKKGKKNDKSNMLTLEKDWEEELINNGIELQKAKLIAKKFVGDVSKIA